MYVFVINSQKILNKPHFDFRGNYEKYLPGVPPLPYFDQSVAYVCPLEVRETNLLLINFIVFLKTTSTFAERGQNFPFIISLILDYVVSELR